jgi:hypothetical protein
VRRLEVPIPRGGWRRTGRRWPCRAPLHFPWLPSRFQNTGKMTSSRDHVRHATPGDGKGAPREPFRRDRWRGYRLAAGVRNISPARPKPRLVDANCGRRLLNPHSFPAEFREPIRRRTMFGLINPARAVRAAQAETHRRKNVSSSPMCSTTSSAMSGSCGAPSSAALASKQPRRLSSERSTISVRKVAIA